MKTNFQLNSLHSRVVNEAYIIYEALAILETVAENQEARQVKAANHQRLIEYVQNIKALATAAHLRGLQEVCAATEQQWHQLETSDVNHCLALYGEVERWPRLVSNYLYSPGDENHANKLVTYLQDTPWQQPLTTAQAQQLFSILVKDIASPNNSQATLDAVDEIQNEDTSQMQLESPKTTLILEDSPGQNNLHLESEIIEDDDKIVIATQANEKSRQQENIVKGANSEPPFPPSQLQNEEDYFDELDEKETISQTMGPGGQPQALLGKHHQDFSTSTSLEVANLTEDYEQLPLNSAISWTDSELEKMLDEAAFDTLPPIEVLEDKQELLSGPGLEEELDWESVEGTEENDFEISIEELSASIAESVAESPSLEATDAIIVENDSIRQEVSPSDASVQDTQAKREKGKAKGEVQHSKTLIDLSNKVVELSDLLSTSLNQWVTANEESETYLEAIERYTNAIHSLWESAEKLNLKALQEVCTFVNDNVFETSALPPTKRLEIRELFALWPKLLLDYLQAATKGATLLVEHLSSSAWPHTLSDQQANGLLVQLVQEAVMPQISEIGQDNLAFSTKPDHNKIVPLKKEKPNKNTEESLFQVKSDTQQSIIPSSSAQQTKGVQDTLPQEEVQDTLPQEKELPGSLLAAPDTEEETAFDQLPVTMPDWGQAFIDEDVQLASDQHDESLLWVPEWQAEATSMAHNSDHTTTTKPQKLEPITNDSAGLLETEPDETNDETTVWTLNAKRPTPNLEIQADTLSFPPLEDDLLLALGSDENEDDLLPELFDEVFEDKQALPTLGEDYVLAEDNQPLRSSEEDEIPSTTAQESKSSDVAHDTTHDDDNALSPMVSTIHPHEFHLASPHVLDLLKVEISEAQRDLSKALNKFAIAEEDSAELLEASEQYRDNVQAIAEAAKKTGLTGLQEVCTFVNDNMFELSTQARIIRRTAQPHLDTWPDLIQTYLQSPLTGAQELVAHLRNPIWPLASDEARTKALLAHLTRGILGHEEDTIQEASELPATAVAKEKAPASKFTRELPNRLEDQLSIVSPPDAKRETPKVASTAEKSSPSLQPPYAVELLTEVATVEEITDRHQSSVVNQILPDSSDLLIRKLTDIQEILTDAWNNVALAEAGSAELFTSVETYTETVQTLWETAETAKLEGIQEVCTFINENMMELSGQDQTTRTATQAVFMAWPPLVVAYLRQPQAETLKLLSHLQDARWPVPLSLVQAEMLRQRLLPSLSHSEELNSTEMLPANSEELKAREVVLASPDALERVMRKLVNLEEPLLEILNSLCEAEDGSEDLLNAASSYTEHVQAVWDAAEIGGLGGLQEVCNFINDNVMALGGQDQSARKAAHDLFAIWPPLTLAYLRHPAQETATLLKHLQDTEWPTPLDDARASALQQYLLPTLESKSSDLDHKAATPEIVLANPDVLEVVGKLVNLEEPLLETLNSLCEAEDGSEDLLNAASTYTEHVQTIWDAAEMAGLGGLQEVCTFINDNVMALGGQNKSARRAAQDLLATWPQLTLAYLRHPAQETATLLTHLQNAKWPTPLDNAQVATLQHLLSKSKDKDLDSQHSTEEPTIYLAAPDILELVRSQLIECQESMSAALEVCMSMESGTPALLEAIENYTNQVQAILETADMAGLAGLQEVCTFINENLKAFGTQEQPAKQAAQPYLEQWPAAVLEYLHSPLTGSQHLVQLLQASAWPIPLEAERASHLLTLLTQSSTSPAQVAAYENEVVEIESAVVAEAEEEIETPEDIGMEVPPEIFLGPVEALGILTEELQSAKEALATELKRFTTLANSDAVFTEAAENYADQVLRLNAAAEMLGLQGLQKVCNFLVENVKLLSKQDLTARTKAKKVLEAWPDLVLAYLNSPMTSVIPMLNHLRESPWAKPLPDDQAHELLELLIHVVPVEDPIVDPLSDVVTREDILITIPGDINPELWEAYLQEVPENAAEFSKLIQSIIRDPQQTGVVEHAKRIAHTLKGSSNIIGIRGLANIAHRLEDILEYIAEHKVIPPKELTDTMVEAADCIEQMVDALVAQQEEPPPQAQQVLQSVLNWAKRIRGPTPVVVIPDKPAKDEPKKVEPKTLPTPKGEDRGTPEQVLKVPTKTVDNLIRLVGELSISLGQIQAKMKHVLQSTRFLTEQELILQRKTFALENLVDVRGVTGIMTDRQRPTEEDEEGFDPLEFEEYNELHSVAHGFIESIADNRELAMSIRNDLTELETMFIHQQRLNKEFEASVMTTRMVPVNTILAMLQRNVRDTCRKTRKKVELEVSGTDILIDSDVLKGLGEALQHILRNAIDHGIESSEERVLLSKPETGTVRLSFYREGNNVVVKCQDDGQGLNYTNIRYKAIERGLLKEGQEVTEAELARIILISGFSTKEKSEINETSGRGVGMDVVHTNIRQMKGTLDLASQTGKGMTLFIKLPMTLVTLHVLLVRIGQRVFGIPTNNLEQALAPGVGEYQKVGSEITFKMGKHFYPTKSLALLLHEPGDRGAVEEDDPRPVILVHEETGIMAVVVDDLIDTHDLVMKSMGQFVKHIHGVAGAAILGDGGVVPLLDLPELLRSPMQAGMLPSLAVQPEENGGVLAPSNIPNIMIVDDSLSVRKSLSLLIEDAGFETMLAKDGLEAIELMNQKRPNVMLVDMEMPRMNGLELTAHVRANQATQKLPIFMITSRTTEKHREQAKTAGVNAYLTKPYQDTELLGLIDKALAGQV